ncbi:MAG: metal-dependent hydrolase, partial [Hyphomicrobiaceae bacterium]|nr:metal-dependent hydrolase [Hyphomicrobiaceae bacterium]
VLFSLENKYSVVEMLVMWLGTLIAVRYGARPFFYHMSYHRGIWHSLVAGLFCAFATAVIYKYLLGRHEGVAWLAAGFMLVGFLTHLILDEIYSVDVMDTRIKSSFGTALKLADFKHPGHSIAMVAAAMLAFWLAPSTKTFADGITSKPMWSELNKRLLPHDEWFGVDWRNVAKLPDFGSKTKSETMPAAAPLSTPISTGSIPPAAQSATEPPAQADMPGAPAETKAPAKE